MRGQKTLTVLLFASMLLASMALVLGTSIGPIDASSSVTPPIVFGTSSSVAIISPYDDSKLNSSDVTISFYGDGLATSYQVSVDSGTNVDIGNVNSYIATDLADGAHTVNVYAYNGGSQTSSDSVTFTVDTVAPTLNITSPAYGSWFNVTTVNVTWSASDAGSGIKNMSVSMDGGAWTDVAVEYMEFTSLAEGAHSVSVRAYDNAGNFRVTTKVFNVDLTLPVLDITNPSENEEIASSSLEVTWSSTSASSAGNYWVSIDGGGWIDVDLNTTYTFSGLEEGQHQVALKVLTFAGNYNTTAVAFTVNLPDDVVAPTVTRSPSGSNVSVGTNVVARFSEAMNQSTVVISVSGVSGTTTWSGNVATFAPAEPLAYGTTYTVNVTGEDLAGNAMSDEWTFTTLQNQGTITGIIRDADGNNLAGALVSLSNGLSATTDENGAFTIENVPSGVYTMTITKDGHPTVTRDVETNAGQTNDLGAVTLVSGSTGSGGLDGTIIIVAAVALVAVLAGFLLVVGRRLKK